MSAIMVCSAVLDWVKEGKVKMASVEDATMNGEEVIYWALCLVCAWMVLMVGAWATKTMIEVFFKSDEEEREKVAESDEGEEAEREGANGVGGIEYKCEMERERPCEGDRRGEVRGKAKSKEKVEQKRVEADEGDPCMPDNREWGEW